MYFIENVQSCKFPPKKIKKNRISINFNMIFLTINNSITVSITLLQKLLLPQRHKKTFVHIFIIFAQNFQSSTQEKKNEDNKKSFHHISYKVRHKVFFFS